MAKIPSRKFSTTTKKIASRGFSKTKAKITSRGFAEGTAKITSRGFAKKTKGKSTPEASTLPERPADEGARQKRVAELKAQAKLKPASELEAKT